VCTHVEYTLDEQDTEEDEVSLPCVGDEGFSLSLSRERDLIESKVSAPCCRTIRRKRETHSCEDHLSQTESGRSDTSDLSHQVEPSNGPDHDLYVSLRVLQRIKRLSTYHPVIARYFLGTR